MKLPVGIVNQLVEMAQKQRMVEMLDQRGASLTAELRHALTGESREWALEALAQSEYFGPARRVAPRPAALYLLELA